MQLRALIVDRNPGFGHLLQPLAPDLEIIVVESGVGVPEAVDGFDPNVAMVDLEAEFAETALAVLRDEGIPVVLNSEAASYGSERVRDLTQRFDVSRFLERPLPLAELPAILRSVAPQPESDATSDRPVAPWARAPEAWADLDGTAAPEPTAQPTGEAPVAPWTQNPDRWRDTDDTPALTTTSSSAESTEAQPRSEAPVPPWEREPDQWAEMDRPVAPWDASPSAWEDEPQREVRGDLQRVNTKALRRLTTIWIRKRTGTLIAEEREVRVAFADGAPHGRVAESKALELLQQPSTRLKFQSADRTANPTRRAFGTTLFRAALDRTKSDWVEANADKALQPVEHLDSLRELPLSPEVVRVLESADGVLNLVDQLTALKLRLAQVEPSLAALHTMGVLEVMAVSVAPGKPKPLKNWVISRGYEGVERRKGERRVDIERRQSRDRRRDPLRARRIRVSGDDRRVVDRRKGDRRSQPDRRTAPPVELVYEPRTPKTPKKPKKPKKRTKQKPALPSPEVMGRLLKREWEVLEHADAWTVLGLPSSDDPKQVSQAGQRMLARYEPVVGDPRYDPTSQSLAAKISERVRWAMENARPVKPEAPPVIPRDELLFEQGRKSLLLKDYETATRCFRTAHKLAVEVPRYMGYYGWALWKAADQLDNDEREAQQAEAEELLRLSDSLDHRDAPIQIFLARVELELGQLKRALARTRRLRAAGEPNDELDLLWDEVQKAVAEAPPEPDPS